MSNIHVIKVPIEERVRLAILRYPDRTPSRIADAIHGATSNLVREIKQKMNGNEVPPPQPRGNALVSLETLKAKFDTAGAVRRELAKLPRGKLIPERELRLLACNGDSGRFNRALEDNAAEFDPRRIKVKTDAGTESKWFWGAAEDVAELQRAIDL